MERRDRLTAAVSVIIILNVFCVFRNLILDNTHTHTHSLMEDRKTEREKL